jgi:cobalt/nickel transport system permease protein
MHIPDGFLSGGLNIITYIAAILVCGYAVKRVSQKTLEGRIPLLGVSAIFILLVQFLNFPIDGVISTHIMGAVLLASILGPWETCLVMTVVLVIQRLIFTYGGLMSLGANVFNLGVLGGVGPYALRPLCRE